MKNKKGFTIVELVIVIAVIAILAGVLIPTFSGVVEKANKSAAAQNARNEYSMYMSYAVEKGITLKDGYIQVEKGNKEYWFEIKESELNTTPLAEKPTVANQKVDLSEMEVKSTVIVTPSEKLNAATGDTAIKESEVGGSSTTADAFFKASDCKELAVKTIKYTSDEAYDYNAEHVTNPQLITDVKTAATYDSTAVSDVNLKGDGTKVYADDAKGTNAKVYSTQESVKDKFLQTAAAVYYTKAECNTANAKLSGAVTTDTLKSFDAGTYYYVVKIDDAEAFGQANVHIYAK